MKNVVKLILISALALVVVSCGNVNDSSDTEKETSSVSSISETDSSNESSETESFEVDSSETDSSEDESSKAVTTTKTILKETAKATTTTKQTTVQQTTTQPVVTQAPITEAPKTTTTVKQTAKPATTTTVKQTVKPATTTTKKTTTTQTQHKDKYEKAFASFKAKNDYKCNAECEIIREYYVNYAVSKFGSRILNSRKADFKPFYVSKTEKSGPTSNIDNGNWVPATWQHYVAPDDVEGMKAIIDAYLTHYLTGDNSDLKTREDHWDIFWMSDATGNSNYRMGVAIDID